MSWKGLNILCRVYRMAKIIIKYLFYAMNAIWESEIYLVDWGHQYVLRHHFVVTRHILTVVCTRNNVLSNFVTKSTYTCSCFRLNSFQNISTWPQIIAKYQDLTKRRGPGSVSVHLIVPILYKYTDLKTIVWLSLLVIM